MGLARSGGTLVVNANRGRALLFALVGALCLGIAMMVADNSLQSQQIAQHFTTLLVFAVVVVPFCMLAVVFFARVFLMPTPLLVVTDEGIFDHASLVGAGWIYWNEIKELTTFRLLTTPALGIVLRDAEELIARQNPFQRLALRLNLLFTPTAISIPGTLLALHVEDVIAQIRSIYADEIARNGIRVELGL